MDFNNQYVVPSGVFVDNNSRTITNEIPISYTPEHYLPDFYICNLGQVGLVESHKELISKDKTLEYFRGNSTKIITESAFDDYSEALLKIARKASYSKYKAHLCPLRGSYKPSMLLRLITNHRIEFETFPFTDHDNPTSNIKIRDYIYALLDGICEKDTANSFLVLDTAKGGYGTVCLAKILRNYCDERHLSIHADFFLLVPSMDHTASRIYSANAQMNERFTMDISVHKVEDLIVEDWDSALGIEVVSGQETGFIKPSVFKGEYLFQDNTGIYRIETPDVGRSIDIHFAEAITENIITNPSLMQTGEVWDYYLNKS